TAEKPITPVAIGAEQKKGAAPASKEPAVPEDDSGLAEGSETADAEEEIISVADKLKDKIISKITFDWKETVGASVFSRAGYLCVVFDKTKDVNISGLVINNPEYFSKGEQMPNPFYTILRFKLRGSVNTAVYKEENNWVVAFLKEAVNPEHTSKMD